MNKILMVTIFLALASSGGCGNVYSRKDFPKDFSFGAGASVYQWEGVVDEDGRKPSVWDTFVHSHNQDNGDITSDGYHKYKEDVQLMVETGLDAYRFSISWSRLIPNGRGPVNPKGLQFYKNFIELLVNHGIQPHVTLYHYDHPQYLENEYGGWLNRKSIEDFTAYADVCFREFGNHVKFWTTINEANIYTIGGYSDGLLPPGHCSSRSKCSSGNSSTEPYIVGHNLLLAHASASRLYKQKYKDIQGGSVGFSVFTIGFTPSTSSTNDEIAVQRAKPFIFGWMLGPLTYGDYPDEMKRIVGSRLPVFTEEESALVKGSSDFVGVIHYLAASVTSVTHVKSQRDPGFFTDMGISMKVIGNYTSFHYAIVPSAPKLRFDSEDYENEHDENFSKIVSESFLSHKAPVLESFHLRFGLDKVDPIDVGFWIGIAFARQLRKLVLDFLELQGSFIFPSSLCTCKTLETLKLRNQILLDISSPASMKSLKKLHLSYVFYKDDETINNLLSGCPSLEELIVDRSDEHTVEFFTINVPSLLRLTIYDDNSEKEFLGYLIEAPSLKYLEIDELRCKLFLLEAPELVEANIYGVPAIISSEFHVSLTSVKRLVLDVSPLKTIYPPIGDIFNQLVYLEMYTREALWWDLLRRMLEHSPKLQVLKLVDEYRINPDYRVCGREWKKPKYVPKCLLSHLETFVWTRYDARRENEEEVATYILKNAKQLKSANFSANPIKPKELKKLAERREMFRKLDGVVKASTSCHLVFK